MAAGFGPQSCSLLITPLKHHPWKILFLPMASLQACLHPVTPESFPPTNISFQSSRSQLLQPSGQFYFDVLKGSQLRLKLRTSLSPFTQTPSQEFSQRGQFPNRAWSSSSFISHLPIPINSASYSFINTYKFSLLFPSSHLILRATTTVTASIDGRIPFYR